MVKAKQVEKVSSGMVGVLNTTANGGSINGTSLITTALSTAASGGRAVPLQPSTDDYTMGIPTASPANKVYINSTVTGDKFQNLNGREVYGRVTQASGVYTITFYVFDGGVETPYNFTNPTNIDFFFLYRFDFDRVPPDSSFTIGIREMSEDPRDNSGTPFGEAINVTAVNTLAPLTKTPTSISTLVLYINGEAHRSFSGAFTIAGKQITWVPAAAKFSLDTTDQVIADYFTKE